MQCAPYLDVNGGQQILLRLRPHWAPNTFYSDEDLVGVMLHEVCPMSHTELSRALTNGPSLLQSSRIMSTGLMTTSFISIWLVSNGNMRNCNAAGTLARASLLLENVLGKDGHIIYP